MSREASSSDGRTRARASDRWRPSCRLQVLSIGSLLYEHRRSCCRQPSAVAAAAAASRRLTTPLPLSRLRVQAAVPVPVELTLGAQAQGRTWCRRRSAHCKLPAGHPVPLTAAVAWLVLQPLPLPLPGSALALSFCRSGRPALLSTQYLAAMQVPALRDSALLPQMSAQLQRLWEQHQRAAEQVDSIQVQLACDAEDEEDVADEAQQAQRSNRLLLLQGPGDAQQAAGQAQADGVQPGAAEAATGAVVAANSIAIAAADAQLSSGAVNGDEAEGAAAGDGGLAVSKEVAFMSPLIQVCVCATGRRSLLASLHRPVRARVDWLLVVGILQGLFGTPLYPGWFALLASTLGYLAA